MKIKQLLEFVDEDFKQMSQQATNIQQGKGNATDAQLRQQRIQQLAANQQARNAAPAGKPMAAPIVPPATTPAATSAAPTTTTAQPTTTQPTTTAPAGQKPRINWGGIGKGALNAATGLVKGAGDIASQAASGITQTVGAAAGGLGAGYHTARQKQSFGSANRGYGPGAYQGDPYQGSGAAGGAGGGNAAGDAEVAKLKSDIAAITGRLDKAGISEKKR
jgi:hypothetical protein